MSVLLSPEKLWSVLLIAVLQQHYITVLLRRGLAARYCRYLFANVGRLQHFR